MFSSQTTIVCDCQEEQKVLAKEYCSNDRSSKSRSRKLKLMNRAFSLYMVALSCILSYSTFASRNAIVLSFNINSAPSLRIHRHRHLTQDNIKNPLLIKSRLSSSYLASSSSSSPSSSPSSKGHISGELIDEIKEEADIITVIESHQIPQFTRLSEDRATALCPFHSDSNPSLNIDNQKGLYKCFACGAGGDVFNFVREYDYLNKNKGAGKKEEKMSYPAAISKVVKEFCSDEIQQEVGKFISSGDNSAKRKMSPEQRRKMEEERLKKERILLANSAAADYYAKLLIASPSAGGARSHLFERGVVPNMVRTFAMGYAPDAYFSTNNNNSNGNSRSKNEWGKGSLVERLEELGFEPREIVEAGLASVTSAAKNRLKAHRSMAFKENMKQESSNSTKINEKKNEMNDGELQYSDLMDRFRDRLMVPIFDSSGKHVLGFGGRDLVVDTKAESQTIDEAKNETKSFFKSPKYLNSPESAVFEKKNVLFGLHRAQIALEERKEKENANIPKDDEHNPSALGNRKASILIVEGYFDVISLYGAGVLEVTASMGAALTSQQLKDAADTIEEGRIVICLDNDDAGIGAVERICSGSTIWDLLGKRGVEFAVANLPAGIKDPGEFVEKRMKSNAGSVRECFENEVINTAMLWNVWYIDRLIKKYDAEDSSSFANVCDSITTFLAKNPNAADRTRQAYEAAGKLATQISGKNEEGSSGPLRIQLESDLLGMASRKATKKDVIKKRIEAVDKLAQADVKGKGTKISEKSKNPSRIAKSNKITRGGTNSPKRSNGIMDSNNGQYANGSNNGNAAGYRTRQNYDRRQEVPIARHFAGFQFNPTDAAWLGISEKSQNSQGDLVLGTDGKPGWKKKKDLVYFNSNSFLGHIDSATASPTKDDALMIASQSNQLLNQDTDTMILGAEFRLLKSMVHFTTARLAMKAALANRSQNGPTLIEWSTHEREWLFHSLTESPGHDPLPQELQDGGTSIQLKDYLMTRADVPDGAFTTKENEDRQTISNPDGDTWFDSEVVDDFVNGQRSMEKSNSAEEGSLEILFIETDDVMNITLDNYAVSHDERAELTVQEAVATLLKATALKRLSQLKIEWKDASNTLSQRRALQAGDKTESALQAPQPTLHENLNDEEVENLCKNLGEEVLDALATVNELTESSKQLSRRLLDYCSADGMEGRLSQGKQEELAKMLAEHLASLPDDDRDEPGYSEDYTFGADQFYDGIDSRYGGSPSDIEDEIELPSRESLTQRPVDDESLFESIFE